MVREILSRAASQLKNSDTPMLDARVLLAKAAGKDNAAMIFDTPTDGQIAIFNEYVKKRAAGMPVAYILGEKEFMGLTFKLNSDTLIPRPDTECLVEKVLECTKGKNVKILDLCTGSGCVGISLAKMLDESFCDLTDISDSALSIASQNARLNGVEHCTGVFKLDVLTEDFSTGYDIIVSNPPYIESDLVPKLAVSEFEPQRALDGGKDGLTFYRSIAEKAFSALDKGGILALEIGYDQGKSVKNLLGKFSVVQVFKDYGGNDRVIIAIKEK